MSTTTRNLMTEWDSWEMLPNVITEALKGCIESKAGLRSDESLVRVKVLNFDKVPPPRAVVPPDGVWHTFRKFIWFCNAAIVDENWKDTFQSLLEEHRGTQVAFVNYHI